ncbi:Sec63 Brl domain-containing protein [Rhodocollybia butyracea]|uniref:DNA 3'-5' helicase n=1 Tax=Rhodocollybia butyracea TaxID=206335 RepID=A0A9P5Q8J8_9AGAR|nr:Sec63 Brl domain-containing protein [Rhodocollybia butyracea]
MDYELEPYYEDQYQEDGYIQPPQYNYPLDGISDDGEFTDEIVNSSPSPRERNNSVNMLYQPRYQPYHDENSYQYQRAPLFNSTPSRTFRPQFPAVGPASQSYSQNRVPFRPPFQSHASSRPTHYSQTPYTNPQIQTPEHLQTPPRTHPQLCTTVVRNPEQAVQAQGYQPRGPQKLLLRPVSDLPDMYRSLFKFGVFNAVQSSCFDGILSSTENMVVSAPTGSGKTVLFELAIIKMLSDVQHTSQAVKCIYVAPTKALCSERYRDWASKFDPLGIKCCELTGDTVHFGKSAWGDAKSATIIITTGEKWDSLTRNWDDHSQILSQIQLFLVDEVHILNETRGSTLEVVVSRMKLRGSSVRFLFVSATVPNIQDIANWIGQDAQSGSAGVYQFGEEYRPCKLVRHVVGFPRPKGQNEFLFSKNLDYKLFPTLQTYSVGKPILVFVSSRKGVFSTAEQLVKDYNDAVAKKQKLPWTRPGRVDRIFNDKRLSEFVALGVGVHHAGLTTDDRRTMEELFLSKVLRIIIATTTLAVGVNLPAHTVVMKGVHTFQNNASVEYSDLDVMQMLGRAGRPQFDKDGIAIIMCESELENKYRALVQGKTVVESSLHKNLSEHLNSEIGLGTITNVNSAKEWIKSSFLFQRIQKNPMHYSLGKDDSQTWEERVDDIVMQSVENLQKSELITKEQHHDAIISTEYGDIMSKFYIRQKTMALILALPERATMREVLEVIALADEFKDSRLRASEKSIYNKLRRHHDIRYEVKKIERTADKILLLIQAILGGISLNAPEFKSNDSQPHLEAYNVFRHLPRIARAVVEVTIVKKFGAPLKHSLELVRCFTAKAWEDRHVVLRQIETIGEKSLKVLAEHGITSIPILRQQDSLRLEALLNRKPPFGLEMLAAAKEFPIYSLKVDQIKVYSDGGKTPVDVELSIECALLEESSQSKSKKVKGRMSHMTAVLTLTSDYHFVDFRRISTKALKEAKTFEVCATLDKPSQTVLVFVSSESYAGVTVSRSFKPDIPPSEYPTMNTKPMTAMELELQGLEDCEGLFDRDLDDHGNDIAIQDSVPVKFKDIRKSVAKEPSGTQNRQTSSIREVKQSLLPTPRKLTNGSYACNHPCKDKQACRHLCCREGLRDPPKTKNGARSKPNANESQKSIEGYTSKTTAKPSSPKPKLAPKKTRMKTDFTLDDLEHLHKNTNVQKNLKLPQGHRIKLDSSPVLGSSVASKRKKGPRPNFDIKFADISTGDVDRPASPVLNDDIDDDFPAPHEILGSPNKKRRYSSDGNYSNSELDALICGLPDNSLLLGCDIGKDARQEGHTRKKTKLNRDSKSRDIENHRAKVASNSGSSNLKKMAPPLFIAGSDSLSETGMDVVDDDDEVEFIDPPTTKSYEADLPLDSPVFTSNDYYEQDDFALDPQYYSTMTATPDLTMSSSSFEKQECGKPEDEPGVYSNGGASISAQQSKAKLSSFYTGAPQVRNSDLDSEGMAAGLGKTKIAVVGHENMTAGSGLTQGSPEGHQIEMEEQDDEFARLEAWLDEITASQ